MMADAASFRCEGLAAWLLARPHWRLLSRPLRLLSRLSNFEFHTTYPLPLHRPWHTRGFGVFSRSDAKAQTARAKAEKRVLFDTEREADEDGLVRGLEGGVEWVG